MAPPPALPSVLPDRTDARTIRRDFLAALESGARLRPAGTAPDDPDALLELGYAPRHHFAFSGARFFLTDYRYDASLNFLVAFVCPARGGRIRAVHPRIFYKDSSLVWRVASHVIDEGDDYWIGKGEVRAEDDGDGVLLLSVEETTNLPYEIQQALDLVSRARKPVRDDDAVTLFLRRAPQHRIEPYADFTAPRRRAEAARGLNGGAPIASFEREGDPTSLRFTPGFEPDLSDGGVETTHTRSRLYGGAVAKRRILSTNRLVQYQFVSSPSHVFLNPPQTLDPELTTYGVRALDVQAAEDAFLPGYEYHFVDELTDPPEVYSQIPAGFVGEPSPVDPARSDASSWIEALPVIRDFRRLVLSTRRRRA